MTKRFKMIVHTMAVVCISASIANAQLCGNPTVTRKDFCPNQNAHIELSDPISDNIYGWYTSSANQIPSYGNDGAGRVYISPSIQTAATTFYYQKEVAQVVGPGYKDPTGGASLAFPAAVPYKMSFANDLDFVLNSVSVVVKLSSTTKTYGLNIKYNDGATDTYGTWFEGKATDFLDIGSGYYLVEIPVNMSIPAGIGRSLEFITETTTAHSSVEAMYWWPTSAYAATAYADGTIRVADSDVSVSAATRSPLIFDWNITLKCTKQTVTTVPATVCCVSVPSTFTITASKQNPTSADFPVTLTATGAAINASMYYYWYDDKNVVVGSGQGKTTLSVAQAGQYSLRVVNKTGDEASFACYGKQSIVIGIQSIKAPADFAICLGEPTSLRGEGAEGDYKWYSGDTKADGYVVTKNVQETDLYVLEPGKYTYTVSGSVKLGNIATDGKFEGFVDSDNFNTLQPNRSFETAYGIAQGGPPTGTFINSSNQYRVDDKIVGYSSNGYKCTDPTYWQKTDAVTGTTVSRGKIFVADAVDVKPQTPYTAAFGNANPLWRLSNQPVLPNTTYTFTMDISNWNDGGAPPEIMLLINGASLNNITVTPAGGTVATGPDGSTYYKYPINELCAWRTITGTWNSGANTTATIAVAEVSNILMGHEFAMDDITFFSGRGTQTDDVIVTVNDCNELQARADAINVCIGSAFPLSLIKNTGFLLDWKNSSGTVVAKTETANVYPTKNEVYTARSKFPIANFIKNGSFELSNKLDFTTDLIIPTGSQMNQGDYWVDNGNSTLIHTGSMITGVKDHTLNTTAGKMMLMRFKQNQAIISKTIPLVTGQEYGFSAWLKHMHIVPSANSRDYPFELVVGGTVVATFTLNSGQDWSEFNYSWKATTTGNATVVLRSPLDHWEAGLAIDDITLAQLGREASDDVKVDVNNCFKLVARADAIVCAGDPVTLNTVTNDGYVTSWEDPAGTVIATSATTTAYPAATGTYIVRAKFPMNNMTPTGNFETGSMPYTTGFSKPTGSQTNSGEYIIGKGNESLLHTASFNLTQKDHTSGSGFMMLARVGNPATPRSLITTSITTIAGQDFAFSAWFKNMHPGIYGGNAANAKDHTITLYIGGTLAYTYTLGQNPNWNNMLYKWNATTTGNTTIEIRVTSTNDESALAMDDLKISQLGFEDTDDVLVTVNVCKTATLSDVCVGLVRQVRYVTDGIFMGWYDAANAKISPADTLKLPSLTANQTVTAKFGVATAAINQNGDMEQGNTLGYNMVGTAQPSTQNQTYPNNEYFYVTNANTITGGEAGFVSRTDADGSGKYLLYHPNGGVDKSLVRTSNLSVTAGTTYSFEFSVAYLKDLAYLNAITTLYPVRLFVGGTQVGSYALTKNNNWQKFTYSWTPTATVSNLVIELKVDVFNDYNLTKQLAYGIDAVNLKPVVPILSKNITVSPCTPPCNPPAAVTITGSPALTGSPKTITVCAGASVPTLSGAYTKGGIANTANYFYSWYKKGTSPSYTNSTSQAGGNATTGVPVLASTTASAGVYYLRVEDGNGGLSSCYKTDSVQLVVVTLPTVTAPSSGKVCSGNVFTGAATYPTNPATGVTVSWDRTLPSGITGTATGLPKNGQVSETLTSTNTASTNLVYKLTPSYSTAPACPGTAVDYTVAVNPIPTITGTLTVCVGSTTQLTGSGTAASANPWVSATTANATISATGLVTGLAAGNSLITYTDNNGCTKTATVVVSALPTVTATPKVCVGATVQLTGSGTAASTTPWISATTANATINGTGLVTGVAAGTSVITYKDNNGCSNTTTVTVNAIPTVTATPKVCVGATVQLTGSGTAASASPWVSATTANATISTTGLVTGVAAGTSVITYKDDNGCSNTTTVTVSAIPTVSATPKVCVGATVQLTGSGTAAAVNPWVSGTSANATISATGLVTGLAAGTSIITYKDDLGCSNTTTLTVNALPTASLAFVSGTGQICNNAVATDKTDIKLTFTGAPNFDFTYKGSGATGSKIVNANTTTTYTIANIKTAETFNIVSLKDGNGCTATALGTPLTTTFYEDPTQVGYALECDPANPTNGAAGVYKYRIVYTGEKGDLPTYAITAKDDANVTINGTFAAANAGRRIWTSDYILESRTVEISFTDKNNCKPVTQGGLNRICSCPEVATLSVATGSVDKICEQGDATTTKLNVVTTNGSAGFPFTYNVKDKDGVIVATQATAMPFSVSKTGTYTITDFKGKCEGSTNTLPISYFPSPVVSISDVVSNYCLGSKGKIQLSVPTQSLANYTFVLERTPLLDTTVVLTNANSTFETDKAGTYKIKSVKDKNTCTAKTADISGTAVLAPFENPVQVGTIKYECDPSNPTNGAAGIYKYRILFTAEKGDLATYTVDAKNSTTSASLPTKAFATAVAGQRTWTSDYILETVNVDLSFTDKNKCSPIVLPNLNKVCSCPEKATLSIATGSVDKICEEGTATTTKLNLTTANGTAGFPFTYNVKDKDGIIVATQATAMPFTVSKTGAYTITDFKGQCEGSTVGISVSNFPSPVAKISVLDAKYCTTGGDKGEIQLDVTTASAGNYTFVLARTPLLDTTVILNGLSSTFKTDKAGIYTIKSVTDNNTCTAKAADKTGSADLSPYENPVQVGTANLVCDPTNPVGGSAGIYKFRVEFTAEKGDLASYAITATDQASTPISGTFAAPVAGQRTWTSDYVLESTQVSLSFTDVNNCKPIVLGPLNKVCSCPEKATLSIATGSVDKICEEGTATTTKLNLTTANGTAGFPFTYNVKDKDGVIIATETSPLPVTVNKTGNYTITDFKGQCAGSTLGINVSNFPSPVVTISALDDKFCSTGNDKGEVQLAVTTASAGNYTFVLARTPLLDTTVVLTNLNGTFKTDKAGTYTIKSVTDNNTCTAKAADKTGTANLSPYENPVQVGTANLVCDPTNPVGGAAGIYKFRVEFTAEKGDLASYAITATDQASTPILGTFAAPVAGQRTWTSDFVLESTQVSLSFTDVNNCKPIVLGPLNKVCSCPEKATLSIATGSVDKICEEGTATTTKINLTTANGTPGFPFVYNVKDKDGVIIATETTPLPITVNKTGNYTITDFKGQCAGSTVGVSVANFPSPVVNISALDDKFCSIGGDKGEVQLAVTTASAGNYTFVLARTPLLDTTVVLTNLNGTFKTDKAGSYTIKSVTDNNTCTAKAANISGTATLTAIAPAVAAITAPKPVSAGMADVYTFNINPQAITATAAGTGYVGEWLLTKNIGTKAVLTKPTTSSDSSKGTLETNAVDRMALDDKSTLVWTVKDAGAICPSSTATIELIRKNATQPDVRDDSICVSSIGTYVLKGNGLVTGETATWKFVSSVPAITAPTLTNVNADGKEATISGVIIPTNAGKVELVFEYSVVSPLPGVTTAPDQMKLTVYEAPELATTGSAISTCAKFVTLTGNIPSQPTATGKWIIVTGQGQLTDASNATTSLTNLNAAGTTDLTWTISNHLCTPPSVANLKVIQAGTMTSPIITVTGGIHAIGRQVISTGTVDTLCSDKIFQVEGNAVSPDPTKAETGTWKYVSGPFTITNVTSRTQSINPVNANADLPSVWQWIISSGVAGCNPETTTVTLLPRALPAPTITGDPSVCEDVLYSLVSKGSFTVTPNSTLASVISWVDTTFGTVNGTVDGARNAATANYKFKSTSTTGTTDAGFVRVKVSNACGTTPAENSVAIKLTPRMVADTIGNGGVTICSSSAGITFGLKNQGAGITSAWTFNGAAIPSTVFPLADSATALANLWANAAYTTGLANINVVVTLSNTCGAGASKDTTINIQKAVPLIATLKSSTIEEGNDLFGNQRLCLPNQKIKLIAGYGNPIALPDATYQFYKNGLPVGSASTADSLVYLGGDLDNAIDKNAKFTVTVSSEGCFTSSESAPSDPITIDGYKIDTSMTVTGDGNFDGTTYILCSGDDVLKLKVAESKGFNGYEWYQTKTNGKIDTLSGQSISRSDTSHTGEYYVKIFNKVCDADSSRKVKVKVFEKPSFEFTTDPLVIIYREGIKVPMPVLLKSPTSDTLTETRWSNETWLEFPSTNKVYPLIVPKREQTELTYSLYVKTGPPSLLNCSAERSIVVINALPLLIPNAFSPNGDGVNDTWVINGLNKYSSVTVSVFNRWGNRVFYSNDSYTPWDGTVNGIPMSAGTYYAIVELKGSPDNEDGNFTKALTIVR